MSVDELSRSAACTEYEGMGRHCPLWLLLSEAAPHHGMLGEGSQP